MTTPTKTHLWQVIKAALDSRNPGDVCEGLLDTYTDLVADAVLKYFDGEFADMALMVKNCTGHPSTGMKSHFDQILELRAELEKAHLVVGEMKLREMGIEPPARESNPWFTKPAEFPLETAEREDRERVQSVDDAHGLANMINRDPMLMLRRGEWHVGKIRDRKADAFRQHYENVARIVEAVATNSESLMPVSEARHRLLGEPGAVDLESLTGTVEFDAMFPPACGQIHDGDECLEPRVPEANGCWAHYGPEVDDERTVRTDRAEESP